MELPLSTAPSSPDDPHAPLLDIRGLVKRYPSRQGEGTLIFDGLDLSVRENEFVALLGHSGSGKSTLLRMIAGLEPITDGIVEVAGRPVTGPGQDRMMIFQHYALLPWLTVEGNIRLAVDEVRKDRSREERAAIVREHIAMVHLEHAAGKRPHELSGGMRQRVGIARALAVEPRLLLMDEPLGALDPFTRAKLQDQILELYDTRRQTVLLVTHDVDEALLMADRIVVLKANGVSSVGEVIEVPFARPRDRKALREDRHYHDLRNATLDLLEQYFETMQAAP